MLLAVQARLQAEGTHQIRSHHKCEGAYICVVQEVEKEM